jgi:hypothetical protein
MRDDSDDKHVHHCNVTGRYEVTTELDDDDDGDADEEEEDEYSNEHEYDMGMYRYTVRIEVQKTVMDGSTGNSGTNSYTEIHEITNVPRSQIIFVNSPYTGDVFLKNAFRHEMMLPDTIFPEAWKYENNN